MSKKLLGKFISLLLCFSLVFIPAVNVNAAESTTLNEERAVIYYNETHYGSHFGLKVKLGIQDSTGQINSCSIVEIVNISSYATNIITGSPIYSSDRRSVHYEVTYKYMGVNTSETITIR